VRRVVFHIAGLDCASEVRILTDRVSRLSGIGELSFDVLAGRMTASFEPRTTSVEQIVSAVAETGLAARPVEGQPAGVRIPAAEPWWKDVRLLTTILSGLLVAAGFLAQVATSGSIRGALHALQGSGAGAWIARGLYALAIASGGWTVAPKAQAALRRLSPDMNLLMLIAVAGAVLLDEWFEAATITFLFSVALFLEHASMARAQRAVAALLDVAPQTARRRVPGENRVEEVPAAVVAPGERVLVRPHERVPLDGRVLEGTSDVDESAITGESMPVAKEHGDEIFAGSINHSGSLEIEVIRAADRTVLARIIQHVQNAAAQRAPSQQWIDSFARWYTPAMTALALAVAVLPPLWLGDFAGWVYRGLVLLVIACPCALVISTPVSIVSAIAAATRHGVLVKGGKALEACARAAAVALDKTGTLTRGRPSVQRVVPLNGHSDREVLERAAALELHSSHPLAHAVLRKADELGVRPAGDVSFRSLPGRGGEGTFDGRAFWIGSHRLMHERRAETPDVHELALGLEDAGHTIIAVGNDDHVCGLLAVADDVRGDAADFLAGLRRLGIRHVEMLTGDNRRTAGAVAGLLGIDSVRADLLPDGKVREVLALRERFGRVAMIGDGVNDAPAMAAADVAIAMAAMGTDAAVETADIALMSDELLKVPWLIAHARRTRRVIQANVVFALTLKAVFLALSIIGAASLWMAIAADTGASLLVIANSLRLLKS
jgi:Cd2+/Zn2+-exporting ATPase